MKKIIIIALGCFCMVKTMAQEESPISPESATSQQLENLTEVLETETEDDTYLQSLLQYQKNKLNINAAEQNELRELRVLTDLQIQSLLRYRQLLGPLINIYELQAVPTFDLVTIQKILPFIQVGSVIPFGTDLLQRFTKGEHTFLVRAQQTVEKSDGFLRPDSILNRYPGSQQRLFVRYKYVYRNLLQFGIVGDKDPGEQFFKGNQKQGFDFYSFHIFARKLGPIKLLALGDFTVNMGQGLIHWQSLAFKKSVDVMGVKRQAEILRPYNSAGEYNFQRGIGATIKISKNIDVTAFGSIRQLDGTFNIDTSINNEDFISSILSSGYHRTPTEVSKKNTLEQKSFGGNISFNKNSLHIGVNGVGFQFSRPLIRDVQPYNQYAIQGKDWHNYSIDYAYTYKNMHFFGEAAMDRNKSKALISGMMISLDTKVDASLVYRNIEKSYQTLYGNAFTESTFPTNEKGLYAGVSIKPFYQLRIDAYADFFSFPWLRYRVDAPSKGSEYLMQITYKPNKQVEVYTRFKNQNKAINISGLNLPTRQPFIRPSQNWRTQVSYKVNRELTLRHRVEIVWFDQQEKDRKQQGFMAFFDASYKPFSKPFSINARLQYFETDGYDSRLYAYENDVLYSFSIPQFAGKGYRYYVNLNFDVSRKLELWGRWAQTIYKDQSVISSGLDKIIGNTRSEFKVQMMYKFNR